MSKTYTPTGVRKLLGQMIVAAGSQSALAAQLGCSQTVIGEVHRGIRPPQPKLLRAMGLQRVVRYEVIK